MRVTSMIIITTEVTDGHGAEVMTEDMIMITTIEANTACPPGTAEAMVTDRERSKVIARMAIIGTTVTVPTMRDAMVALTCALLAEGFV